MKKMFLAICIALSLCSLYACATQNNAPNVNTSILDKTSIIHSSKSTEKMATPILTPAPSKAPKSLLSNITETALAVYFEEYDNATMLISDSVSTIVFNESFSEKRLPPYSTFKILNALVALEEDIVRTNSSMRKWDGTVYKRIELNKNQDIASAIQSSCVWYFKQLAREIGMDAMKHNIDNVGYGNMDISGGIDEFWLGSSLLISTKEQLSFIARLYNGDLPFSQANIDFIKSTIQQDGYDLEIYGKTGSSGKGLGWFIGYVVISEKPYYFVVCIESDGADGALARDKAVEVFINTIGI